ncbi:uncharacterized protein N7477_003501 [Penicillium maclennaniae]|uniref:uncharacterized protein n=1 Tax=Penicillium maclennaniae TaxID=1343394 RepID=UPI002540160D|nr:uncharacterized protein N7477_003501 [Penicillium maclennaniae]KAJ5677868.1 hypothetical protein N7477_003501 [Penicillium maclennaniae]
MPDRSPDKPKPNYLKGDGKFKRQEPELGFFQTKLRDKEGLEAQKKRHVKDKKEKEDEKEIKPDQEEVKAKGQKRKV